MPPTTRKATPVITALQRKGSATSPGAAVTLGIRPENVALAASAHAAHAAIDGEVTQVEPLGAETIVFARMPGIEREMVARVDPDAAAPIGARCTFHCNLATAHVFDSAGNAV